MHTFIKKIIIIVSSTTLFSLQALTPYYGIRSQGVNAARDLVGLTHVINLDEESLYGTCCGLFEYTKSLRPNAITHCLFGADLVKDCCTSLPSIVISGSQTPNRAPTDWLADYFALPTNFKSVITFAPKIQNFIIELDFYIGLDNWLKGLYFRANAPITHTTWDLDFNETVSSSGSNITAAGYYTNAPVELDELFSNFTDFVRGDFLSSFTQFDNLANARMSSDALVHTGLAELRACIGWNYEQPDYHAGVSARFAIPTGNVPRGEYVFEPMVGNGHHWEFGIGLTGHYTFWKDCEEVSSLGFYIDANITHLFTARQHRTFDLINKPNSRYMLAQKIQAPTSTPTLQIPTFQNLAYANELSTVANLTTVDVNVDIAAQGDIVALLNFTHAAFSWDIGYNFWAISCEKIKKAGCPSALDDGKTWALKGDAFVVGFQDDHATTAFFQPVYLAATESLATIHAGTNFPAAGTTNATTIIADSANPTIDSPLPAVTNTGLNVVVAPEAQSVTNPQTNSSALPYFLSLADIDFSGNSGLSQKVFTHLNYTFPDRSGWIPYVGVGAEAEFGNKNYKAGCSVTSACQSISNRALSCPSCTNCSVSQWGVWLKGGVAY